MYTMIPFRSRRELAENSSLLEDRFFRSFFNMSDWLGGAGFRVDIHEEKDRYLLEAELPGAKEDQISLTLENDRLTIAADLHSQRQDENAYYSERVSGRVSRSFNVDGIDRERITADYQNGVLTVTLPKEHPGAPSGLRRIPIGDRAAEPPKA